MKLPNLNRSSELPGETLLAHPLNSACSTCGFPDGEPGYIRTYSDGELASNLTPCPDCHDNKQAERAQYKHQLEGDLRTKTFDNYLVTDDNRAAYQAALEFAANPRGFLTLWGGYGPGKTHLLAAITIRLGKRARYFTFPDLVSQYRESVGQGKVEDFYGRLCRVEVLLIDEIDKVELSGWTREQSYRIFDYRYRNTADKGLVMALNKDPNELDEAMGYLFSRMKDDRFKLVYVGGGDVRPKASAWQKLLSLRKIKDA
jgi:DNA replication protein DnaC